MSLFISCYMYSGLVADSHLAMKDCARRWSSLLIEFSSLMVAETSRGKFGSGHERPKSRSCDKSGSLESRS